MLALGEICGFSAGGGMTVVRRPLMLKKPNGQKIPSGLSIKSELTVNWD